MKNHRSIIPFLFLSQLISHSTVFAQQWQYLGLGTEHIKAIAVDWSNPNFIYAGTAGGIFKSTNTGATWDTLVRDVRVREIVIHPKNHNIIYATVGVSVPSVVKSNDGGTSWIKADSGIQVGFVGTGPIAIDPDHPDTLYVGTSGNDGRADFYRSTDGGRSWSVLGGTTFWSGVTALAIRSDSTNIVYAAEVGNCDLLKSTDYGVSWSVLLSGNGGENVSITSSTEFAGNNPSTFYLGAGWSPQHRVGIFKTTDGGLTWEHPTAGLPDTLNVYSIQIYSDSATEQLFFTGRGHREGGIFESTNGNPWRLINNDSRFEVLTLFGKRLYAGGVGVYAMDISTSVSTDVPPVETFRLDNNYPNPFNPSTAISYQLSAVSNVTLKVYDVLGREVATLVNEKQNPGEHVVRFDGSRLAGGVYFYRLSAPGINQVKKMLLIR